MTIKTTAFDSTYHHSFLAGNNTHGFYVIHNIDVFNVLNVEGVDLSAVYQTGESYEYNDYHCPSSRLELSEGGGTHPALIEINKLFESDFDDDEYMEEILETVAVLCSVIDSVKKIKAVYDALNDNLPNLSDFLDEVYTDDVNDYLKDEATGILTLKS